MASFTTDELDFIRCRGNEFCSKIWGPPKEELERRAMVEDANARLLDLLIQKYERKRWYSQPTDEMYAEARKANTLSLSATSKQPESLVMPYSSQPAVGSQTSGMPTAQHNVHSIQRPSPSSLRSVPGQITSPLSPAKPHVLQAPMPVINSNPHQQTTSTTAGFADFANFDAVQMPPVATQRHQPTAQFSLHGGPLPSNGQAFLSRTVAAVGGAALSDKYAALTGIDTAATAINWDGQTELCQSKSTSAAAPAVSLTSSGSNPFAVDGNGPSGCISSIVAPTVPSAPTQSAPQYVLMQTSSGHTCYVPVAYSPFGASVAPSATPFVPAVAAGQLASVPHTSAPAGHSQMYAANPFLQNGTQVRRDATTNPFL